MNIKTVLIRTDPHRINVKEWRKLNVYFNKDNRDYSTT